MDKILIFALIICTLITSVILGITIYYINKNSTTQPSITPPSQGSQMVQPTQAIQAAKDAQAIQALKDTQALKDAQAAKDAQALKDVQAAKDAQALKDALTYNTTISAGGIAALPSSLQSSVSGCENDLKTLVCPTGMVIKDGTITYGKWDYTCGSLPVAVVKKSYPLKNGIGLNSYTLKSLQIECGEDPLPGTLKQYLVNYTFMIKPVVLSCIDAKNAYLNANTDVKSAGIDAWFHYTSNGKSEGRTWNGVNCPSWVEGSTVRCEAKPEFYRFENGKKRNYPTPLIAGSWDPNWANPIVYDCAILDSIPLGDPMELKTGDINYKGNTLLNDNALLPGTGLKNKNGTIATLQYDGNFVIKSNTNQVLWETKTSSASDLLLSNGNVIIRGAVDHFGKGNVLWNTATNTGVKLILEDSDLLILYDLNNNPVWWSNTFKEGASYGSGGKLYRFYRQDNIGYFGWYPNESIAASWNPDWNNVKSIPDAILKSNNAFNKGIGKTFALASCAQEKADYTTLYNDIKVAGVDPWMHYKAFGKKEGRIWSGPDCANQDLKSIPIISSMNSDTFLNTYPECNVISCGSVVKSYKDKNWSYNSSNFAECTKCPVSSLAKVGDPVNATTSSNGVVSTLTPNMILNIAQ